MRLNLLTKPCVSKAGRTPPLPLQAHPTTHAAAENSVSAEELLINATDQCSYALWLQLHRTATRGVEEAPMLRFHSFMQSVALLPLLRRTTTLVATVIDQSDTRARSPSLPFFSLYLPPLAHLLSALNGWEAETFGPLVCS